MYLYITKKKAIESGLTHEGYLFGCPAWFAGDDDSEEICMATPKFWPLHAWCLFADCMYEIASYFMPKDRVLASPIRITNKIEV